MKPGPVHWLAAFVIALGLHGVALRELLPTLRDAPAVATTTALDIDFVDTTDTSPKPIESPAKPLSDEPEPEHKPEPDQEPEPDPEPLPEPKPVPQPTPQPKLPRAKPPTATHSARTPPAVPKPRQTDPAPGVSSAELAARTADYSDELRSRIERNKSYPRRALLRSDQGKVKLFLSIAADGGLLSARVISTSGHPVLDDAALRLAHDSNPFPPPPDGAQTPIEVIVPVAYRLR